MDLAVVSLPEHEQETWKQKRTKELGFKPQHEQFHNFYLPYADKLDEESAVLLNYIKQELGRTFAMREINPGAGIFVTKLMRYTCMTLRIRTILINPQCRHF